MKDRHMNISEVVQSLEEFKSDHITQLKELRDQVTELEAKGNRQGLGGFYGGGSNRDAEAERKALAQLVRTGDERAFASALEGKGLLTADDTAGGYTVAPTLSSTIMTVLRSVSPMRRLARIETIGGDAFEEPQERDETGAEWAAETESRTETGNPSFGLLRVPCEEVYALVPVTQRLLDDSRFDLGSWIEQRIAEKFARTEGVAYITGDGIKKPKGITSYATATTDDDSRAWGTWQHVVSGAAAAVTADGLRNLYWSLAAGYRSNASWLMSSATAGAIDKLKDGNGDYLWRDSSAAGAPPTLLGRPVEFDESMPAVSAGNLSIAFGDWRRAYLIADKRGIKFLRDPFSSKPNVLFYSYKRTGGGAADFRAAKFLKISA